MYIQALCSTPCLSASSLDLAMVLLLIFLAHLRLQSGAPLAATKATTESMMGNEFSEEAPGEAARDWFWDEGVAAWGEKVPWP